MAIELELPTDIRKHEQKTVGPLTTKQFCYTVPAVILGLVVWNLTKKIGGDIQLGATLTVALPLLVLGFGKVYGLPLDKFLFSVGATIVSGIIDPKSKHRIYKTENVFLKATDSFCRKEEIEQGNDKKLKKKHNKKRKASTPSKAFPKYQ